MITRITNVATSTYQDSGQTVTRVDWVDERGRKGSTVGSPDNAHMIALIRRAERECAPATHS
jgi:hypothetical protein